MKSLPGRPQRLHKASKKPAKMPREASQMPCNRSRTYLSESCWGNAAHEDRAVLASKPMHRGAATILGSAPHAHGQTCIHALWLVDNVYTCIFCMLACVDVPRHLLQLHTYSLWARWRIIAPAVLDIIYNI